MGLLDDILPEVVQDVLDVLNDGDEKPLLIRRQPRYNPITQSDAPIQKSTPILCSPLDMVDERDLDGEAVVMGDAKVITEARGLAFEPTANDCFLKLGGREWKIVKVSPVYAGKLVATYTLFLRK